MTDVGEPNGITDLQLEPVVPDVEKLERAALLAVVAAIESGHDVTIEQLAGWEAATLAGVAGAVDAAFSRLCAVANPEAGGDTACADRSQLGALLQELDGYRPPVPDLTELIAAVHAAFDALVDYGQGYNTAVRGFRTSLVQLGLRQDESSAATSPGRTLRALPLTVLIERLALDVQRRHHLEPSHVRRPDMHTEVDAQLRGLDRVAP